MYTPLVNEVQERTVTDFSNLARDQNANNDFENEQIKYFKMLHESTPDPDSLSAISDYSEMGHEIKQSIEFSEMIISTYSDLKNPNKSVTTLPNTTTVPDLTQRKYNMLSLAMEFSKWKELNFDESISDSESRLVKNGSARDAAMVSNSPSMLSEYSSADHCFESPECRPERLDISSGEDKSPLQVHIDHKFDEAFSDNRSSSEAEPDEDYKTRDTRRSQIVRPAWAQSIFHRETLLKMPKSVQAATNGIRNFDLSKEKCLTMLSVPQLQLVANELMSQIEDLNECLVSTLISRDELRSEQTSMVIQVEDLTTKAKDTAQNMQRSGNNTQLRLKTSQNYGLAYRFLTNLVCSPKYASNRVLSFFTQNNVPKIPPPEFV